MMKILTFLLFAAFLISCSKPVVSLEVENHSGNEVDSLIVSNGYDYWSYGKIGINEKIKGKLIFSEKVRNDGGYQLTIFRNNKIKSFRYGYYTNGLPSSNQIDIEIEKDTVKMNEIF
ncbi:MAG: hypothetical protein DI539_08640 [Flavobacterium psychrophilum]|nr:MAG: hypothetical protein DI539_08640 [Flavobacterium psychrophilum]